MTNDATNYCQVCGELIPRRKRPGSDTALESVVQYMTRKTCGRGTTCYTTMLSRVQSGDHQIADPVVRYNNRLQVGKLEFCRYTDMQKNAPTRWAWYGGQPMTESQIKAAAQNLIKHQRHLA